MKNKIKYSQHFQDMLAERNIKESWVQDTLSEPDDIKKESDGTTHYVKSIDENEKRWLRVVINSSADTQIAVTAFFDRRIRSKEDESEG